MVSRAKIETIEARRQVDNLLCHGHQPVNRVRRFCLTSPCDASPTRRGGSETRRTASWEGDAPHGETSKIRPTGSCTERLKLILSD